MGRILDNRLSGINASIIATLPSQGFRNDLQYKINTDFEYSSTYYVIEKEESLNSQTWVEIGVRINKIIDAKYGKNLVDDFRELIFKDASYASNLGERYKFDNYVWMVINTDNYKSPTTSCVVRRCNYTLEWMSISATPTVISQPCIIDYFKFRVYNNVEETKNMILGNNLRYVLLQNNDDTINIDRTYRFIIDFRSYRVVDFDRITLPGICQLTLEEYQENNDLDLIRSDGTGIVNYYGTTINKGSNLW